MYKPYDPNLVPPKEPAPAKVVYIKHLKKGMEGNLHDGSILIDKGVLTITIPELKTSISVTVEDVLKAGAVLVERSGDPN
jgi:hypothetical protein